MDFDRAGRTKVQQNRLDEKDRTIKMNQRDLLNGFITIDRFLHNMVCMKHKIIETAVTEGPLEKVEFGKNLL